MRDGNKNITSGPTDQVLHKSFLIATGGIAEIHFKTVMCSQSLVLILSDSGFAVAGFYSDLRIVEDDTARNTAEEFKGMNLGFKKRLRILPAKTHDKGSAAVTKPGTEVVESHGLALKVRLKRTPVDLHSFSWVKYQLHKSLLSFLPHTMNHVPYGAFCTCKVQLIDQSFKNTAGRMMLLMRGYSVFIDTALDKLLNLGRNDRRQTRIRFTLARLDIALGIFSYSLTGDSECTRDSTDTHVLNRIHPANFSIIFHGNDHLWSQPFHSDFHHYCRGLCR